MKRKRIIQATFFLLVLFCLLFAGFFFTRRPLSPDDGHLHESMKLFFALDGEPVKGDFFQAQLLDACQIESVGPGDQRGETRSYYYTIAFAPLTDMPYKMTRIEIQPLDDAICRYLQKHGTTGSNYASSAKPALTGAYGYDDLISSLPLSNSQDFFPQGHEEFQAYVLGVSLSDLGTVPLEQAGLSPEDFEQGIRGIRLIIHYGLWQKDELILSFDGEWGAAPTDDARPDRFLQPLDSYEQGDS